MVMFCCRIQYGHLTLTILQKEFMQANGSDPDRKQIFKK